MTLKDKIQEVAHKDGYSVELSDVFEVIDAYNAELIQEMGKMKHQQCLKVSCVHNDAISACQRLVKEKNG